MSERAVDIAGSTGAEFTFTLSAGKIISAVLKPPGTQLRIGTNHSEVTVPSLPHGDSKVMLNLSWQPDESDAIVDLGAIIHGRAQCHAEADAGGRCLSAIPLFIGKVTPRGLRQPHARIRASQRPFLCYECGGCHSGIVHAPR